MKWRSLHTHIPATCFPSVPTIAHGEKFSPLDLLSKALQISPCSPHLVSFPASFIISRTCLTFFFLFLYQLFLLPGMNLSPHPASELLLILKSPPQHGLLQLLGLNWFLSSLNSSGILGFPVTVLKPHFSETQISLYFKLQIFPPGLWILGIEIGS